MNARGLFLVVLAASFLASACGGSAPSLSELSLSKTSIKRGEEVFGVFRVQDPDGDLDRSKINIGLSGHDVELNTSVFTEDVAPGTTDTRLIAGVTFFGALDPGGYQISFTMTDADDNESDPVQSALTLQ